MSTNTEVQELINAAWNLINAIDGTADEFSAEVQELSDILSSDHFFNDLEVTS